MTTYWDIRAALPGRPRWQLVGFAAGCAKRLAPMAAHLGVTVMAEAAEAGGNLAWAAAGQRAAKAEVEQTTTELIRLLDATPEDPLGLSTYAVEALHVTVLALKTASTSTPTHEAQAANQVAIDLLGQVDFLLPHNPLDEELLIQRPGDPQAIEAVRRLSTVRAAELVNVIPQFEARWIEEAGRR